MNTFTLFALVICAIFAMVSAVPIPAAPADVAEDAPGAIPKDDILEGAESRRYGYNRHGGGGGHYGHGHYGHGHYGHGHYGHGHYGHGHY